MNRISVVALIALVSLCSCLTASSPLGVETKYSEKQAYLYGVFWRTQNSSGTTTVVPGLVVRSSTGHEVLFEFKDLAAGLQVVSVTPGTYTVTHAAFLFDMTWEKQQIQLPPGMSFLGKPFRVRAGEAVYLGDFHGKSTMNVAASTVSGSIHAIKYTFEKTTRQLIDQYSHMNGARYASLRSNR